MIKNIFKTKLSSTVIALVLVLFSTSILAGTYIFAGLKSDGSDIDIIAHPTGYTGNGGTLTVTVGISPNSPHASEMEASVRKIIRTVNQRKPTLNNLSLGNDNDVPSRFLDFESIALHELGHCIGLGHVNLAAEPGLSANDQNFTKAKKGSDRIFSLGGGNDGVRGSSDDSRGDDVNLHWFRIANNNPFTKAAIVDSSTYSRDLSDLPRGDSFATNGDRSVGILFGHPNTEAVMQQGTLFDEVQRDLIHDDVATIEYAMSGLDEIAGSSDDYDLKLVFVGESTSADIILEFNSARTGLASCQLLRSSINRNHARVRSAKIFFSDNFNWHFPALINTRGTLTINNLNPIEGQILTAKVSDIDGVSEEIQFQWLRNGKVIQGQDRKSYLVKKEDIGSRLKVSATYIDDLGTRETLSSISTNLVDGDSDPTPLPPTGALGFETRFSITSEDAKTYRVAVVRTGGSFNDISIDFTLFSLTATESLDFQSQTGTLDFPQGVTKRTITIKIIDDQEVEKSEVFLIGLNNFKRDENGNGRFGDDPFTVIRILDND